ncbi:MAG TPA: lipoprotein [Usitatibacter sp.]|nr:lipoprotein [Usitatibacter sp.]
MIRAAAILALALALAGCGQKGPLKLPDQTPPGAPQPVPATPPSSP